MAALDIFRTSKKAFWYVEFSGIDLGKLLKTYISSISIEYKMNQPTMATISVTSPPFLEGLLVEGQTISIYLGYNPFSMIKMIEGKILDKPEGQATEILSYAIKVIDDSYELTKKKMNKVFELNQKNLIITQMIAQGGFIPVVDISDKNPMKPGETIIQKNQTDWEFLAFYAKKWNCICWHNEGRIYFVDAEKAATHEARDRIKDGRINIDDMKSNYALNYRLQMGINNISRITWKKNKGKGGGLGEPGVKMTDEKGLVETKEEPFKIEYGDKLWVLKEKYKNVPEAMEAGYYSAIAGNRAMQEDKIREYFEPLAAIRSNAKDASPSPVGGKGFEIEFELNKGDVMLRPPRKSELNCGTMGDEFSFLPEFLLYNGKKTGSLYTITEVKTELAEGMLKTSGLMVA